MKCIELYLGEEQIKSSWVRMKGQTCKGDAVVGVCYRLLKRKKWMKPSTGNQKQFQNHGPWFMGRTLTALTSAGEHTQ